MATKQPCPRCGWPTKFFVQVRRSDGDQRYVCLPCVFELGHAMLSSRDTWINDNQAWQDRLLGEEAD